MDVHFHHIEQLVREFKPRRVAFDSLSTYGSTLGTNARIFRDFFHALVALMKEYQSYSRVQPENPEMLGMASMMGQFAISSLVDNILLMNWIELGDSFRLGLTLAKMRANPVDRVTRECEFSRVRGCACYRASCLCQGNRSPLIPASCRARPKRRTRKREGDAPDGDPATFARKIHCSKPGRRRVGERFRRQNIHY